MKTHFKVVEKFQTLEFDIELDSIADASQYIKDARKAIYDATADIEKKESQPIEKKEFKQMEIKNPDAPATENQMKFIREKIGLNLTNLTKSQASKYISDYKAGKIPEEIGQM